MKKKIYIPLIIVLFIIIFILFDLFVPRGKKLSNIDYKDYDKLLKTYSIKENYDMVEITLYNTSPLTNKMTYKFQNDDVIEVSYERIYLNKFEALWYYLTDDYKEKYNANLKNNVIKYSYGKDLSGNNTKSNVHNLIKQIREDSNNNIISVD